MNTAAVGTRDGANRQSKALGTNCRAWEHRLVILNSPETLAVIKVKPNELTTENLCGWTLEVGKITAASGLHGEREQLDEGGGGESNGELRGKLRRSRHPLRGAGDGDCRWRSLRQRRRELKKVGEAIVGFEWEMVEQETRRGHPLIGDRGKGWRRGASGGSASAMRVASALSGYSLGAAAEALHSSVERQ